MVYLCLRKVGSRYCWNLVSRFGFDVLVLAVAEQFVLLDVRPVI